MKCKFELVWYLLEACEDPKKEEFDTLDWWRVIYFRYRVLSQVAYDVLAILVSTIASESAFSTRVEYKIISGVHCLLKLLKFWYVLKIFWGPSMNQLTYERQWMKWKTMKLNRVMCLCFFTILCFCHLFVSYYLYEFFSACIKTQYGYIFYCSGLMWNVGGFFLDLAWAI